MGNVTGSASRIAPSAPLRSAIPVSAPVPDLDLLDGGVERGRGAVAERRRPHRHRGAVLDLAPVADHAARAAADQRVGRQQLVDGLEHQLGPAERAAGSEHDHEVTARAAQLGGGLGGGVERGRAGLEQGGETGSDADGHSLVTILVARARHRRIRADRSRQDRRGHRARGAPACARRGPGRRVRRRDAGLRGPADPHRRGRRARAGAPRAPPARLRADRRDVLRRRVRAPRARGDRRPASRTAAARSSSAAPACTCAPRSRTSTSDHPWTPRSGRPSPRATSPSCTPSCRPSLNIRPTDTHRIIRAHELLAVGEAPPSGDQLWTTTRATRRSSPRS